MHATPHPSPTAPTVEPALSPAQARGWELLQEAVKVAPLVLLEGNPGSGKTLLARRLVRQGQGLLLSGADLMSEVGSGSHPGIEERLFVLLSHALERHRLLVVDDCADLVDAGRRGARGRFLTAVWHALADQAQASGHCLVLAGSSFWDEPGLAMDPILAARALDVVLPPLQAKDFAHFLALHPAASAVDAQRVHRYAPNLNVYQLGHLAALVQHHGTRTEEQLRELIETRLLKTNTRTDEVADVQFSDLKGFEDLIDQLNTFVVYPLRQDPRFVGMDLRPKRGVLLYGPPGTGKTSVGRALARQMKGKFFLIDGTIPPEPARDFFKRVKLIFEEAQAAAPSVLFIDDADVLFQSDRSTSLNRYLLTMLDGLESETAGKVAVVMTAMDPNHLPPPLLRSGRVELWLQTRPPNAEARAQMLRAHLAGLPAPFATLDVSLVQMLTEGFSAADMRRIVADVKALYAADLLAGRDHGVVDSYFVEAAMNLERSRESLQAAVAGTSRTARPAVDARSDAQREASSQREAMSNCEGE